MALIQYGPIVVNHQRLTRQQTQRAPHVNTHQLVVMYDPDAPTPYVHWIYRSGKTIVPYVGPNPPPTDTHYHRYMFEVLEPIGKRKRIVVPHRSGFDIQEFKDMYGFVTVGSTGFYVIP